MIGVPATLLLALVIAAGVLAREQHEEPVAGAAEDDVRAALRDVPDRPTQTMVRRLPMVVPPVCIPLPGHACWAGRLRLPVAVRERWLRQRSNSPAVTESFVHGCFSRVSEDRASETKRKEAAILDDEAAPLGADEEAAVAAVEEPMFMVEAVPRGMAGAGPEHQPVEVEVQVEVEADGTFVAQVPPGTYDLEAVSDDELLVAGLDGLQAVAGEARGELDMMVSEAVAVSGTMVDEYGISVEGELRFQRHEQAVTRSPAMRFEDGRFTVHGLRPGAYTVVPRVGQDVAPPVQVRAPATGIVLRAPTLLVGMLLVGPQSDGECPARALVLLESIDSQDAGVTRGATFVACRAIVWNVRPGSRWAVTGQLGEYTINQVVTFGSGPTLPPVCLKGGCATDAATIITRAAAGTGEGRSWLPVHLLDGPANGPAKGERVGLFPEGYRAGLSYTFSVDGESSYASQTVTLVPGVNTIVFGRP